MEENKSKVYILLDSQNRIIRCEGGYTTPADLTGWAYIDEGTGDRYNLCQSHYFPGGLYTEDGIPRYRWDGSAAILRTDEELDADRAAIPKPEPQPAMADIARMARYMAQGATDAQALTMPTLYREWSAGTAYGGDSGLSIVRQPGTMDLYRLNEGKAHTAPEGWEPASTPSLWTAIDQGHAGTLADPIPARAGMEYIYGLYYADPEDGKTYLCKRTGEAEGEKIVLQYLPHELVGQYFEAASAA